MAATLALPQASVTEVAEDIWREASWLPCRLRAEISVRGFTMSDLMHIEVGSVVDSGLAIEADLTVSVNGAWVGYGKLDLSDEKLAVRLTELA